MSQSIEDIDFEDLHRQVYELFAVFYNKWWIKNHIVSKIQTVTLQPSRQSERIFQVMIDLGMIGVKKDSVLNTYKVNKPK
jgi:hypothetical protein